jgi:hypothetical protein
MADDDTPSGDETTQGLMPPEVQEEVSAYQEKVRIWLVEKWGDAKKCPMCDVAAWTIVPQSRLPLDSQNFSNYFAGKGVPVVLVVCSNCGNTVMLNGIKLGVDEPDPQPWGRTS